MKDRIQTIKILIEICAVFLPHLLSIHCINLLSSSKFNGVSGRNGYVNQLEANNLSTLNTNLSAYGNDLTQLRNDLLDPVTNPAVNNTSVEDLFATNYNQWQLDKINNVS